jgi:hypothetical protein
VSWFNPFQTVNLNAFSSEIQMQLIFELNITRAYYVPYFCALQGSSDLLYLGSVFGVTTKF